MKPNKPIIAASPKPKKETLMNVVEKG